ALEPFAPPATNQVLTPLLNLDPTPIATVEESVNSVVARVQRGDQVIVAFSVHGQLYGNRDEGSSPAASSEFVQIDHPDAVVGPGGQRGMYMMPGWSARLVLSRQPTAQQDLDADRLGMILEPLVNRGAEVTVVVSSCWAGRFADQLRPRV